MSKLTSLPVDESLDEIIEKLKSHSSIVVSAAPGAGKTTRIPPALVKTLCSRFTNQQQDRATPINQQKILVLEPRRVAALAAATRIAEENGWALGKEVGYQVRFENKTSSETQLIFLTEALLSKKISADPELSDVSCVILDEFHERSIHVDLALGLLKELQELSRPDLKIVVMSATLDATKLSEYLGQAPIIQVPGKTFPLEVNLSTETQLLQTNYNFIDRVVETIKKAWATSTTKKDILVFLPGIGEIARVKEKLSDWSHTQGLQLMELHGSLQLAQQKEVLQSSSKPKIVLTTNIAESSLTLNGMDTVVDSGLARRMIFHSRSGLSRMETGRISKASATQRAGRACRQYPGRVFRMWAKMDELSMPDFDVAEIHRVDLTETLLSLAGQGLTDFRSFSWFDPPQTQRLELAIFQLKSWGCLDEKNQITDLGKKILKIPLHPRLARLFIACDELGQSKLGADLCTLISEKDILPHTATSHSSHSGIECDLQLRLDLFNSHRDRYPHLHKISDQIEKLGQKPRQKAPADLHDFIQTALLAAYADRLCRRRRPEEPSAVMIGGKGAKLSEKSFVKRAEYFVALDLAEGLDQNEAIVSKASAISKEKILKTFSNKSEKSVQIQFDSKTQKLTKTEFRHYQGLPLEEPRQVPLTAEEAQEYLPDLALSRWDELLRKNEALAHWVSRFEYFIRKYENKNNVELDEELKSSALKSACFGEKKLEALWEKDLIYHFESQLPSNIIQDFHQSCPSHLEVPTGTRCKISYYPDKDPSLEVRLQEVFGWSETPTIMNGKVRITLHLLAPNYRPVQVTQDLASFWKNGYPEVRKELRSRYPKHSWPDDPLTAPAVAKGRRR